MFVDITSNVLNGNDWPDESSLFVTAPSWAASGSPYGDYILSTIHNFLLLHLISKSMIIFYLSYLCLNVPQFDGPLEAGIQ